MLLTISLLNQDSILEVTNDQSCRNHSAHKQFNLTLKEGILVSSFTIFTNFVVKIIHFLLEIIHFC